MCVCVGVCGCAVCGCVVCVVWVAHISIVKTKKLRFFRIFYLLPSLSSGKGYPLCFISPSRFLPTTLTTKTLSLVKKKKKKKKSCGAVELWSCGAVELWSCGAVELWSCGAVELWSCGAVELWSCGAVELWSCGAVELWSSGAGCGAVELWSCECASAKAHVAHVHDRKMALFSEIIDTTSKLVRRVRELDGDFGSETEDVEDAVEDAELGLYFGGDREAKMYSAQITELEEEKLRV